MKFLVDNLLFYLMVQSSSLVLWSSYFLIDSCWVQSLIWHISPPPPPLCPSLLALRYTRRAEKCARQSVLEFSERTHRVASTDQGQGLSPFIPSPRLCAVCHVRTGVPTSPCASSVPGTAPRISFTR